MKSAPFKIKQLFLDDAGLRVRQQSVQAELAQDTAWFPAYTVTSTAPPNVEEAKSASAAALLTVQAGIDAIARNLYHIQKTWIHRPSW
ncbi:MAG: hypothetical protein HC800_05475 [Phormidesmis sp. RL_2_1]|nr:hypothetical protein [Phormidesmis sp. RL_2_1]